MSRQLGLFRPPLNPAKSLKEAMRKAVKISKYSREQIADRMNEIAASEGLKCGRSERVTVAIIDAWLCDSKSHLISLGLLPAFCIASDSLLPMKALAASVHAELVDEQEMKILALAKLDIEARRLSKQRKLLRAEIKGDRQ